jgi:hypothetical protein
MNTMKFIKIRRVKSRMKMGGKQADMPGCLLFGQASWLLIHGLYVDYAGVKN